MEHMIRLLRADEIECRVSTINEKGISLLLFKDARVDQKILDEAFGPLGWKRTHQSIDGNLYCTVEVWDGEKQQWVAKQDVGIAGYAEKEKGQASDSFKRACFNWGVGRELYTAPFLWVPAVKADIRSKDGRYVTPDRFHVQSIAYNEQREIAALTIINNRGQTVFAMGRAEAPEEAKPAKEAGTVPETKAPEKASTTRKAITVRQKKALEKELERTGVAMEAVLERYRIQKLEQMTPEIYQNAMNSLKKTKAKEAA